MKVLPNRPIRNISKILFLLLMLFVRLVGTIVALPLSENNNEDLPPFVPFKDLSTCNDRMSQCNSERFEHAMNLQNKVCPKGS